MTIVEFFDKTAIENVLSGLLCGPDRVVYIGDSSKQMNKAKKAYQEVLEARGRHVELSCMSVARNNLQGIVEALTQIVEQDADCVFNLDGGEDLYLVAIGMVAQKYPDRVKLHRFNVSNNTIIDCDADGNNQLQAPISIGVEENIRIYGGTVIYNSEIPDGTHRWELDGDFRRDIARMWEICRKEPSEWNSRISTLIRLGGMCLEENPLCFYVDTKSARNTVGIERFQEVTELLLALSDDKLISGLCMDEQAITFAFKNQQVKDCLTKAGQVLELTVAYAALESEDKNGQPVYDDVMSGVYIDWDGIVAPFGTADVANEIDVFLMKGAVPVFISCKNGQMEPEELFKLAQVSQRFGDKYAKNVLVATHLDKMGSKGKSILARAKEMNIEVIDDLHKMPLDQCSKAIKNLWRT